MAESPLPAYNNPQPTPEHSLQPLLPPIDDRPVSPLSEHASLVPHENPPTENSSKDNSSDETKTSSNAHKLFNTWWLELLVLVTCTTAFIALVCVLAESDGQPISRWTKFPISLNAIVSILAGIANASLTLVISMCLSQTKWNWASEKPGRLIDFDRFDAASRGPWGSVRLMRSFLRRPNFDERTIRRVVDRFRGSSCDRQVLPAGLRDFIDTWWRELGIQYQLPRAGWQTNRLLATLTSNSIKTDMSTLAAMWAGFSPLTAQQNLWPSFTCTTGNCSWDSFESLAICSKCSDLSQNLKKFQGFIKSPDIEAPPYSYTWNGTPPDVSNNAPKAHWDSRIGYQNPMPYTKYVLPTVGGTLNLSNFDGKSRCKNTKDACPDTYLSARITTNLGQTHTFQSIKTLILAFQYLQANPGWMKNETTWEETQVTAGECGLYFCINEYEPVLAQGVLREKVRNSWTDKVSDSYTSQGGRAPVESIEKLFQYLNHSLDMDPDWVELSDLQLRIPDDDFKPRAANLSSQQAFHITQPTVMSILNVFQDGFVEDSCAGNCSLSMYPKLSIYPSQGGDPPTDFMLGLGQLGNVSSTFSNVALSLTKWMRDRELESAAVAGRATQNIVVIRVIWGFLGLPAATLVLGFVFVLLSIWETHRLGRPAWKDRSLATLAYAPGGELQDRLQAAAAVGKIQHVGRGESVAMEYRDGLGRLVSKERLSATP